MCTTEDIQKIDKGTHVIVNKWEHYLKLFVSIVAPIIMLLTFVVYGAKWTTEQEYKTFNTVKEKEKVLNFVELGHPISTEEKVTITSRLGTIESNNTKLMENVLEALKDLKDNK